MRQQLESLIDQMLDGRLLLEEARAEFEQIYIEKSLARNAGHISKAAKQLGIHRNTLSKRVSSNGNGQKLSKVSSAKRSK